MSQSRNRRPASRAREPPRAAPQSGYVTNEAKDNYGNKNTYKIPRNVRYDLENALVGLCDIWFEEIKPHLIKNKLKVHTGGVLDEGADLDAREHRRDGREEPRRAPGRTLLDPGAAPDELQTRRAARCRVSSPTRPAASRAPCPKPPSRTRPLSPTNFRKLLQLPDDTRSRSPIRSTPVPPLVTKTRDPISSKQRMRPPVREMPPRLPSPPLTRTHQNACYTPEQKAINNKRSRKSKQTQKIPQFPPSLSPRAQRQVSRPCCVACALEAKTQTDNFPPRTHAASTRLSQPRTKNTLPTNPLNNKANSNWDHPTQYNSGVPRVNRASPAGDTSRQDAVRKYVLSSACSSRNVHARNIMPVPSKYSRAISTENREPPPTCVTSMSPGGDIQSSNDRNTAPLPLHFRRPSPCPLRGASKLPAPAHARCLSSSHARSRSISPPPVSPPLSEDEAWFQRIYYTNLPLKNDTRPHAKESSTLKCDISSMSSKKAISINHENRLKVEDSRPLFSKDLIDLIGDKNDERLRVLYENPTREESQPSIMCLAGSRKMRNKTAPKKMPWR